MNKTFQPTTDSKIGHNFYKTAINGLFYISHNYFPDDRGFYSELALVPEINQHIAIPFIAKQLNQSRSNKNVIRGIHAEDWNKLVSVTNGECFCALVDLRKESLTFGKSETFLLGTSEQSLRGSIYISKGIGNSFCVTQGPADYVYAVDALYSERDKSKDVSINLFDPDIAIDWPIPKESMILSQRDQNSNNLNQLQ